MTSNDPLKRLIDEQLAEARRADRPWPSPWPWAIVLGGYFGTLGAVLMGLWAMQMQLITAGVVAPELLLVAALLGGGGGVMAGVVAASIIWVFRIAFMR